nr:uncharacterized protein LOC105468324 [Macaca nemestrina]
MKEETVAHSGVHSELCGLVAEAAQGWQMGVEVASAAPGGRAGTLRADGSARRSLLRPRPQGALLPARPPRSAFEPMQTPTGPHPPGSGDPLHPPSLGLEVRRPVAYRLEEVARCLHLLELSSSQGPGCGPGVSAGLQVHRLQSASQETPGGAFASNSPRGDRPFPRSNRRKAENPTQKGAVRGGSKKCRDCYHCLRTPSHSVKGRHMGNTTEALLPLPARKVSAEQVGNQKSHFHPEIREVPHPAHQLSSEAVWGNFHPSWH